jgi:hypothetical protein
MSAKNLRIIHLPFITGNSAWYLSKYERLLVSKSEVFYFTRSNKLVLYDELRYDRKIEFSNNFSALFKIAKFYLWAIPRFDVFHFNAGSALVITPKLKFLDFIDVRLLRLFNKKIVFTYQGTPGRIRKTFFSRLENHDINFYLPLFDGDIDECIKLRRISIVNRFSHLIYSNNPDVLLNFDLSKSFFRPHTKMDLNIFNNKQFNKRLKIVHFPTDRKGKGSDFIDSTLKEIITSGFDVEYISMSSVDNKKVRDIMSQADILIDQLLVGWYGGVAVEAMNYGVPVLCYLNSFDLDLIPSDMKKDMPIVNVNMRNFKYILTGLIENPEDLIKISLNGYEFLQKWHNPQNIASKIVKDYESLYV